MDDFIREWKSVSDDTLAIASAVGNEILKHSKTVQKVVSPQANFPYKEGEFKYNVEGLLGKINNLTVKYTIYYCRDERDYEYLTFDKNRMKCDADYDDEFVEITAAYIGDKIQDDFIGDINHEINHLLQYSKGFNKTERFENRYNTAVSIAQNRDYSWTYRVPSLLLYYTFRHEVDSFAVQFYALLKSKFKKYRDLRGDENRLTKLLEGFQPYVNLTNSIKLYNDNVNTDEVREGIKALRMNPDTFEARIDKGVNRFMRKMRHVYDRFYSELNQTATAETIIRRAFMLHERFGDMKMEYERAYRINE